MNARTERLIALVEEGATLEEAGRIYGISRERVRQILKKEGITTRALPRRAAKQRARRPTASKLGTQGFEDERSPDAQSLQALRDAARILERPPAMHAYDRLRVEALVQGPPAMTIAHRWGWANACELAGLTASHVPRSVPGARSPDGGGPEDPHRAALCRVARLVGHPPTQAEYHAHKRDGDPSAQAIRVHYGGWLSAREAIMQARGTARDGRRHDPLGPPHVRPS